MGGYKAAATKEDFWQGFQKFFGYSDEEMIELRKHPKKSRWAPIMAGPDIQNSTMVFEVVESHGCGFGMKKGDRIYFTGCALMDPKRSSPWCAFALDQAMVLANTYHNMILHGIDPNDIYADHFSCTDCGSKYGWGQVIMKTYVIKEDKK